MLFLHTSWRCLKYPRDVLDFRNLTEIGGMGSTEVDHPENYIIARQQVPTSRIKGEPHRASWHYGTPEATSIPASGLLNSYRAKLASPGRPHMRGSDPYSEREGKVPHNASQALFRP